MSGIYLILDVLVIATYQNQKDVTLGRYIYWLILVLKFYVVCHPSCHSNIFLISLTKFFKNLETVNWEYFRIHSLFVRNFDSALSLKFLYKVDVPSPSRSLGVQVLYFTELYPLLPCPFHSNIHRKWANFLPRKIAYRKRVDLAD